MSDSNDNDDRAVSGGGATWVAPPPEEPRKQERTMLVPNPVIPMDDEDTSPPVPLPQEQTVPHDPGDVATAPQPDQEPYSEPPMRIADFFPTGEEIMPLVKGVKGMLRAALYYLRRAGRLFRDRVYRPARDIAVEKIRELTQESPPDKIIDNYSDTFSRKRAKKWQKFREGKTSSSYLQDDDSN